MGGDNIWAARHILVRLNAFILDNLDKQSEIMLL